MGNRLHLDVAQLTDVGRKREHNEDNMAYVIPKDVEVMTKKGALFIVADGMGGHAAGEVASEIAVDTVSNTYYQDDSDDVADALVRAIRRANAAIHQRAAENMLRSGMGTTCVAATLRGNRAYIANVGDSRAYLVRNDQARQVSQDHSWVAEQVRAGLLTEEQARTHAQRNVITRCLGTQADVEIDVFSEELEEGDCLVLCTDGLSGLVSDDELQKIVNAFVPQESVYHLVERANENGGPDNITAIVVRVQEVGVEPPNARHPVRVGGRMIDMRSAPETGEDTTVLGLVPGSQGDARALKGAPLMVPTARNGEMRSTTAPLRVASGPLASPDGAIAPLPYPPSVPLAQESAARRRRLFYPSLALLVLIVVALVGGGIYYYFIHKSQDVEQLLQRAQGRITQAELDLSSNSSNPGDALQQLALAQIYMHEAKKNHLSDAQNTQATMLLTSLEQEVRRAIDSYNAGANAAIHVLPCDGTTPKLINDISTTTHAESITAVQVGKAALLYALSQNANVFLLNPGSGTNANNYSLQSSVTLPQSTRALALAGSGNLLFVLYATSNGYSLSLYQPDASGNLGNAKSTVPLSSTFTKDGKIPILVTASNQNVYVVLKDSLYNALLLSYSVKNDQITSNPKQLNISGNIKGVAALPNELFLLLDGGAIESLQFSAGSLPVPVLAQQIVPPLATSDVPFTADMKVPVPQKQNPSPFLMIAGATSLSAGIINNVAHLYINDPMNHRIIDLTVAPNASPAVVPSLQGTPTPSSSSSAPTSTTRDVTATPTNAATNVTLQLFQQYVSSIFFSQVKGVAVDPQAMVVSVLIQMPHSSSSFGLIPLSIDKQSNCTLQAKP